MNNSNNLADSCCIAYDDKFVFSKQQSLDSPVKYVNQDYQNKHTTVNDNEYVRSTELSDPKEYVNIHDQKMRLLRKIYSYRIELTQLEKKQIVELLQTISIFHKQESVCNKNKVLELYQKYKTTLEKININLLDVIKLTFANNSYSLKTIINYMDKINGGLD